MPISMQFPTENHEEIFRSNWNAHSLQESAMHGQEQDSQLKRMRLVATGLLVAMAVLFLFARASEIRHPVLSFVAAFAEAALVGALADWFAVTALFRSPLGLPIPHTAIIPKNKDRIANSLSDFIEHNFLTRSIIQRELRAIDFAGAAAGWLANPVNSRIVSRQIVQSIPSMLHLLEDEDVRQYLRSHLIGVLESMKPGPALADILSMLAANRYHQQLFTHLVGVVSRIVENNQPYLRWRIHESSPRWMPRIIDDKICERLLEAIQETLGEMREEDSEWRLRFQNSVDALIEHLRVSPEYQSRLDGVLRDVVRQPLFHDYVTDLWKSIRSRLIADAVADDSRTAMHLNDALQSFSQGLLHDAQTRSKLNEWAHDLATDIIFTRREFIADLISRVIQTWDAQTMSRKLEQHIGKDLQYIRINGTLVGGLVGLVLHAVSLALARA
jgi:uncharacterized membrane-anchored protein YjiN (DUF445 family)